MSAAVPAGGSLAGGVWEPFDWPPLPFFRRRLRLGFPGTAASSEEAGSCSGQSMEGAESVGATVASGETVAAGTDCGLVGVSLRSKTGNADAVFSGRATISGSADLGFRFFAVLDALREDLAGSLGLFCVAALMKCAKQARCLMRRPANYRNNSDSNTALDC